MLMVKKTLQTRLICEQHSAMGKMISRIVLKYPRDRGVMMMLLRTNMRSDRLRKVSKKMLMLSLGLKDINIVRLIFGIKKCNNH